MLTGDANAKNKKGLKQKNDEGRWNKVTERERETGGRDERDRIWDLMED